MAAYYMLRMHHTDSKAFRLMLYMYCLKLPSTFLSFNVEKERDRA